MPTGPLKVVLIHTGKYDYAEVELDAALQIVGPNNTGKTTLINTLQFLYIDDLRRMDFGPYSHDQTREYYFPDQYSHILFECLGAQGNCVIGWRGQSKASGQDPERFFYRGPFAREDFFDGQAQVREPRDVSARLALRQYERIDGAQHHRQILLAATGPGAPGLGVVSLRENDKYHQFRDTLKNLLSLSTITQDQMRERLLMLAEIPADAVALDARQLFGEDYDLIRRRREALLRFKAHADPVKRLVAKFAERDSARGELIQGWTHLRRLSQEFTREHDQRLVDLQAALTSQQEEERLVKDELADRRADYDQASQQKGALNLRLTELETVARSFADYVEDLERQGLRALEGEIVRLQGQLAEAETESLGRIEQRVTGARAMVQQKEATLRDFDRLLVTDLRRTFADAELEVAFSLLNFDLLEYPVGAEGVTLRDRRGLEALLREVLSRVREGAYQDPTVTIRLKPGHRRLADLENAARVREELEEWRRTLDRLTTTLTALRQREQLQTALGRKKEERELKAKRLFLFEEFQKAKAGEAQLRTDFRAVEKSLQDLGGKIAQAEKRIEQARRRQRELEEGRRQAEDGYARVMGQFNQCRFPEFTVPETPLADLPPSFEAAIALFLRQQGLEERLTQEVGALLLDTERVLGEEYLGLDERETIRNLEAELDALPDKEQALAKDWDAHLQALKGVFDQVLKELSEVKSGADQLNRQFKAIQVSNIRSLRLDILEQSDVVTWLRRLAEFQQPGLFDEDVKLETTLRHFRQRLEANPVIRYADLFTLRFTVVGEDEVARHYQDFKQIESHGTTITIKVLFNLLVLKSLLRKDDCLVPFFLDEIQALDEANRRAILATARRLGFIAITAAPEAVGEVDSLYYLQPRRGRVTLKANHRLRLVPTSVAP